MRVLNVEDEILETPRLNLTHYQAMHDISPLMLTVLSLWWTLACNCVEQPNE
ncbi:hypothetical protein Fmac_022017 [Flemingia macrophylla]|uniref:Uncharacterized protein n=1 Tax=Flemingia macrophylla TaxID=520843 RepID=A0ABD1LYI2_9FABA